jgi:hypothetical protein
MQTTFQVRERDGDLVGRERAFRLRPGVNEVTFEPIERYRFSRNEHCFDVIANIAGTARRIDAEHTFCARQLPGGDRSKAPLYRLSHLASRRRSYLRLRSCGFFRHGLSPC